MTSQLWFGLSPCRSLRFEDFGVLSFGHVYCRSEQHQLPSKINHRSKLEIGQTSVAVMTDENAGLAEGYR